jgi:hypothetical protein
MEEGYVASRLVRREVIKTSVATTPTSSSIHIFNAELHFSHLLKNGAARGWLGGSNYSATTFATFRRQQDESALLQEFEQHRSLKRTVTGEDDGDSVDDS